MIQHRRHRLVTVLFALASLLFAQLALAGYACQQSARAAGVSTLSTAAMPCAESMGMVMDAEQPGLCHAHCQAGPQAAEPWHVPVLASLPDPGAAYLVPRILPAPPGAPLQAPLLRRTTAPPLAIRNCCFRI